MRPTTKKDVSIPDALPDILPDAPVVREHKIEGKSYIVKSVFVGDKDIQAAILKLAEQKALREMGLNTAFG